MRIPTTSAVLAAATLLIGTLPMAALAKDYCFLWTVNGAQRLVVGKGFKLPGKGKCKPFIGYEASTAAGRLVWSGAACTSDDATLVHINLTGGPSSSDDRGRFLQIELYPKGSGSSGVWETTASTTNLGGTANPLTNGYVCSTGGIPLLP